MPTIYNQAIAAGGLELKALQDQFYEIVPER
jgi:hypothetical protein